MWELRHRILTFLFYQRLGFFVSVSIHFFICKIESKHLSERAVKTLRHLLSSSGGFINRQAGILCVWGDGGAVISPTIDFLFVVSVQVRVEGKKLKGTLITTLIFPVKVPPPTLLPFLILPCGYSKEAWTSSWAHANLLGSIRIFVPLRRAGVYLASWWETLSVKAVIDCTAHRRPNCLGPFILKLGY